MKLTKYDHACFTVEKDSQILVVDPGGYSTDFLPPENVVAVVITHEHPDHFDPDQIAMIMDKNPEAFVVSVADVTAKIEAFNTKTIQAGDTLTIGLFDMEFFGGTHATIHESMPTVANIGIMINDLLYYPGDSFVLPGKPVDTLAMPAAAPWMKIGEAMNFLSVIRPRFAFPTHDAILSPQGKGLADSLLAMTAEKYGCEYRRLNSPLEI